MLPTRAERRGRVTAPDEPVEGGAEVVEFCFQTGSPFDSPNGRVDRVVPAPPRSRYQRACRSWTSSASARVSEAFTCVLPEGLQLRVACRVELRSTVTRDLSISRLRMSRISCAVPGRRRRPPRRQPARSRRRRPTGGRRAGVPPRTAGRSSSPPRPAGSAGGAVVVRAPPVNSRKRSSSRSANVARGRARRRAAASSTAKGRPSNRRQTSETTSPACPSALKPGWTARARSTKSSTAAGSGQASHRNQDFAGNAERLTARRDQSETRHRADQGLGQRRPPAQ